MTWNRRYQVKSYLRSSLWIIPLFALLLQQVAWALAHTLDTRLAWKGLALGLTGAQAMFNAVITLTLSFIVFTFGSLLIAIQVASGQYTPRIIATTYCATTSSATRWVFSSSRSFSRSRLWTEQRQVFTN